MISIFGVENLEIKENYNKIDSLTEITETKLLIAHFNKIKNNFPSEGFVKNLIVIDDEYNGENALYSYQNNANYYIPLNSKISEIIEALITGMYEKGLLSEDIIIDEDLNELIISEKKVKLSSKEMEVYKYLYKNRGKLCLRERILVDVLGYYEGSDSRIVDVYIKYLRNKLYEEGNKIETIRGKGYIYKK